MSLDTEEDMPKTSEAKRRFYTTLYIARYWQIWGVIYPSMK